MTPEEQKLSAYQRRRDSDPAITVYWMGAPDGGRMANLNSFSCTWCKNTLMDNMAGTIDSIINTPMPLNSFRTAWTVRCKYCKQKWRFVVLETVETILHHTTTLQILQ